MKYQGCTLEVMSLDQVDLTRGMRERTKNMNPGESIVRKTILSLPNVSDPLTAPGIDRFLENVDEYMLMVASTIGASVVAHEWCLLPKHEPKYPSVLARFGLPDFILGASVKVIEGIQLKIGEFGSYFDFQQKLQSVNNEFLAENGWVIPDIAAPHQYMASGVTEDSIGFISLVDIEPRVTDFIN